MADKKSSPVRPPTLEGKAKPTPSRRKSTASRKSAASKSPEAAKSDAHEQATSSTSSGTQSAPPTIGMRFNLVLSAIVGAIIAGVIFFALTYLGLIFSNDSTERDTLRAELDQLQERATAVELGLARQSELAEQITNLQNTLETQRELVTSEQNASAETITQNVDAIGALKTSIENLPTTTFDDTQINQKLTALESEIIALQSATSALQSSPMPATNSDTTPAPTAQQAVVSAQDLQRIETEIETILNDLKALTGELEIVQQAQSDQSETLTNQQERLDTLDEKLASQAAAPTINQSAESAVSASMTSQPNSTQISLATTFENARMRGLPYREALSEFESTMPGIPVAEVLAPFADEGLPTMGELSAAYSQKVPALFAAIAPNENASWATLLLDRVSALFAIRSTNASPDTPRGSISAIETALRNGDISTAATISQQLPNAVTAQIPDILSQIKAHYALTLLIVELRTSESPSSAPQATTEPANTSS